MIPICNVCQQQEEVQSTVLASAHCAPAPTQLRRVSPMLNDNKSTDASNLDMIPIHNVHQQQEEVQSIVLLASAHHAPAPAQSSRVSPTLNDDESTDDDERTRAFESQLTSFTGILRDLSAAVREPVQAPLHSFGELSEQFERVNSLLQTATEQQNTRSIAFYTNMLNGIELELQARSHRVAAVLAPPPRRPQQESHQDRSA